MSVVREAVYAFLDGLGIEYRVMKHERAASVGECAWVGEALGAMIPKNIFLSTRNGKRHYLCIVRPEARFHTAAISKQVGSPRLSFADEQALLEMLQTRPGSISPMGLLFDRERHVGLLIDRDLRNVPVLGFHPCENTETFAVSSADFFETMLPALGISPFFVTI